MFPPYDNATMHFLAAGGSAEDHAGPDTPASDAAHVIKVRKEAASSGRGDGCFFLYWCLAVKTIAATTTTTMHSSVQPRCVHVPAGTTPRGC